MENKLDLSVDFQVPKISKKIAANKNEIADGIANIQVQLAQVIADISNYVEVCSPHLDSIVINLTKVKGVLDSMGEVNPNIYPVKYTTLNQWRVDLASCLGSLFSLMNLMTEEFEKLKNDIPKPN